MILDTAFLTIYDPATRPLSFLGIEGVTLACGALTLVHALRARRLGDGGALFAWVCTFVYGVCLEIASYNAFPKFSHGQFTVMFYHHKLPLYISAFYPMINYTGQRTVQRLGLSARVEPLVVGLLLVLIDLPFDTLGPDTGWWAWDMTDPNVHARWFGVPVTSYYWQLSWGAILSGICRWAEPHMRVLGSPGRPIRFARLALALPVAGVTMALGRLAFLPFDVLVPLGVPDGTILVVGLGIALALLVLGRREPTGDPPDRLLLAIPFLFFAFHVALVLSLRGRIGDWGGKTALILGATVLGMGISGAATRAATRSPLRPARSGDPP